MQQFRKMDKLQIAQINKYNVIRCLMREGPINRAAVAKRLGLSIPTVMFITEALQRGKVIRSIGKGASSGGKPPEMLEIVPERFYYLGLDVGGTAIRAVAADALSRQVVCLQEPANNPVPEKRFVDRIGRLILKTAARLKTENGKILGVGVAMPGLIEKESGTVLFSPDFGWNNIPLQEWLGAKIPFPVMVENANRALALNEVFLRGEDASHTWFWSTINKFDMRLDRTCHYAYSVSIAENNNIPGIAQKVSDGISPLLALRCDAPVSPQSLLTIENENLITTAVEQKEAGIAVRMYNASDKPCTPEFDTSLQFLEKTDVAGHVRENTEAGAFEIFEMVFL